MMKNVSVHRKNRVRGFAMLVVGLAGLSAIAADGTWLGATSGNWSDPTKWNTVPGDGGAATITGIGSAINITNDVTGLRLNGLYIPSGTGGSLTVSGNPITFTSKSSGNNIASRVSLDMRAESILEAGAYPHVFAGSIHFRGVVSGVGALQLATDNPVINLYGANTYTGGTVIPCGNVYVYNLNGLGANAEGNAASVTVAAGNASYRLLRFAVADGVFYHPITSTARDLGGAGTSMVNVHATENTTLKGNLSGGAFGFGNNSGKTLTVDGDVDCGAYGLYLYPVGNRAIVVNGKVTASAVASSSGVDNTDTQFVLANPANNIAKISLQTRSFCAGAANVCTGSVWESTQDTGTKALWFLNDHDQTIDRILTDSHTAHAGLFVYSGNSAAATEKAATLTMKATADANISYCFQQHTSLVWDPQGDYTLTLRDRNHATDGTLEVKGGSLVLTGATKMLGVTGLTVGQGATCSIAAANERPFTSGKVALSLDADAVLDIGNKTLSFASITIGNEALDFGVYTGWDNAEPGRATKLPQLRGTGVISSVWTPTTSVAASWIGGSGESLTTDANWLGGVAPAFASNNVLATFSDASATGFRAVAPSTMTLNGIVFSGQSFELAAQNQTIVTLATEGISVNAQADQEAEYNYRVTAPVGIVANQAWNTGVSAKNTLFVENGLYAAGIPDAQVTVSGSGTFRLTGTADADYAGSVEIQDCLAYVSGSNPFGKALSSGSGGVLLRNTKGEVYALKMHFGSCTIDKPVYLNAYSTSSTIFVDANAEVYFKNKVQHNNANRWSIGANAKVYFDGGFFNSSASWQSVWWNDVGTAEIYIRNVPIDFGCVAYVVDVNKAQFIPTAGTWHFQVAGNKIRQLYVAGNTYSLETDWAIDSTNTIVQWRETNSSGCIEMNGHPARIGTFVSISASGRIKNSSSTPAALYVVQCDEASSVPGNTATNKCDLVGNIDFHKSGIYELAFDRALSATGTVEVTEGRLVLTETASWLGASEVVVAANADTDANHPPVLEIAGSAFSKKVNLTLGTGAAIAFAGNASFVQRVASLTVGGVPVKPGTYTAANAPEGVTFTGAAGGICVIGDGTTVILR